MASRSRNEESCGLVQGSSDGGLQRIGRALRDGMAWPELSKSCQVLRPRQTSDQAGLLYLFTYDFSPSSCARKKGKNKIPAAVCRAYRKWSTSRHSEYGVIIALYGTSLIASHHAVSSHAQQTTRGPQSYVASTVGRSCCFRFRCPLPPPIPIGRCYSFFSRVFLRRLRGTHHLF